MYQVILASSSPRRRDILKQAGIRFIVKTSNQEEITAKQKPDEIVMDLAQIKAQAVAQRIQGCAVIIGADTLVSLNGQVMGKPKNNQDAAYMLHELQGQRHQVYTGVSVILKQFGTGMDSEGIEDKIITFAEKTDVWVNSMNEEQIQAYIATGEPIDKAGGYGIQGQFAIHIGRIEGDYYNIVGFPISRFYKVLLEEGIDLLNCK